MHDDDAAQHVAEDDLQKAEVAGEGEAGHADDGERAGFRGDDGERDGPPGHGAVGEEVALKERSPLRKRSPKSVIPTRYMPTSARSIGRSRWSMNPLR